MMGKPTPGPWSYRILPDEDAIDILGAPGPEDERRLIAQIRLVNRAWAETHNIYARHNEEAEANARLIAAAPELLGACMAARQYIIDKLDWFEGDVKLYDTLTQAIAKAREEAP